MVTLRESEERFRQLAENIDEVFWLTDVGKHQMLYVNPAYDAIWGRRREDLYRDAGLWLEAVHPEDRDRVAAAVDGQARGEYDVRYRIVRPDGGIRWIRDRAVPVRDESGAVVRLAGVAADVTALVEAEQALQESEERLRQIAEHLDVGVWIYTANFSSVLYASPKAAVLWGVNLQAIYDDPLFFMSLVHPEDAAVLAAGMQAEQLEDEWEFQLRRVHPDGSVRWLCIKAFAIRDAGGKVYRTAGITEDITEARAVETALRDRETHYRRLVETSPYAIYGIDAEGRFTEMNPAGEEVLGRPAREIVGRSFLDVIHEDDVPMAMQVFDTLQSGDVRRVDMELRVTNPLLGPRTLSLAVAAVYDPVRGAGGTHGIGRDVTEEREREQHMRRVERFATMGTLVSGVAHELNNPLQSIAGFADLLLEGEPDTAAQREALETIAGEARRASRIVAELRTLARRAHEGATHIEPVDVNDVVRRVNRARKVAQNTSNIEAVEQLAAELPVVMGDRDRLEQVLVNLVVNAEQALADVEGTRRIVIRTRPTARGVALTVEDSGPGIDMKSLPHLFDPFWTTKPPGMGTGLGLSVVHSIVQEHGGSVNVESEPGRGARFRVDLPAVMNAADASPGAPSHGTGAAAAVAEPPARSIRLLTVDDEASIRQLVTRLAQRRGHRVEQASDGGEALRMVYEAETAGDPFDLIISDLRMPGLGGLRLIEELTTHDARYAQRIVLMTGDPDSAEVTKIRGAADVQVAAKPLGVQQIVEIMKSAEDREQRRD